MPYQNTSTPRFFINMPEFCAEAGITEIHEIFRTLPVKVEPQAIPTEDKMLTGVPFSLFADKCFCAFLGHRITDTPGEASTDSHYYGVEDGATGSVQWIDDIVVNCTQEESSMYPKPIYNGFTIASFHKGDYYPYVDTPYSRPDSAGRELGSIVIGNYYNMPHSPDLKLTMTREGSGAKHIRSQNGSSFSNSFYTKSPTWGGNAGAWELYPGSPDSKQLLSRSGRRVWDLSFNYLSDSSIFPETSLLSRAGEDGYTFDWNNYHNNTLLYDDNFYSQVIHKTNGGELPFIFQPDRYDNTQFAIAKFDGGFKFTQVANSVYSISLKIRECW